VAELLHPACMLMTSLPSSWTISCVVLHRLVSCGVFVCCVCVCFFVRVCVCACVCVILWCWRVQLTLAAQHVVCTRDGFRSVTAELEDLKLQWKALETVHRCTIFSWMPVDVWQGVSLVRWSFFLVAFAVL
jgi:hypothetical protein